MPGVTTTRRPPPAWRANSASATRVPLGLELKVSSITHTPDGASAEASRFGTGGNPAMRDSATSCGTPSANATASAQARFVGCTAPGRTTVPIGAPAT